MAGFDDCRIMLRFSTASVTITDSRTAETCWEIVMGTCVIKSLEKRMEVLQIANVRLGLSVIISYRELSR